MTSSEWEVCGTYIYIAGIDVVSLTVHVSLQRPQHHTMIIICTQRMKILTHGLELRNVFVWYSQGQMFKNRFFVLFSALVEMVVNFSSPLYRPCIHTHHTTPSHTTDEKECTWYWSLNCLFWLEWHFSTKLPNSATGRLAPGVSSGAA